MDETSNLVFLKPVYPGKTKQWFLDYQSLIQCKYNKPINFFNKEIRFICPRFLVVMKSSILLKPTRKTGPHVQDIFSSAVYIDNYINIKNQYFKPRKYVARVKYLGYVLDSLDNFVHFIPIVVSLTNPTLKQVCNDQEFIIQF